MDSLKRKRGLTMPTVSKMDRMALPPVECDSSDPERLANLDFGIAARLHQEIFSASPPPALPEAYVVLQEVIDQLGERWDHIKDFQDLLTFILRDQEDLLQHLEASIRDFLERSQTTIPKLPNQSKLGRLRKLYIARMAPMKSWGPEICIKYEFHKARQHFADSLRQTSKKYPEWIDASRAINCAMIHSKKGTRRNLKQGKVIVQSDLDAVNNKDFVSVEYDLTSLTLDEFGIICELLPGNLVPEELSKSRPAPDAFKGSHANLARRRCSSQKGIGKVAKTSGRSKAVSGKQGLGADGDRRAVVDRVGDVEGAGDRDEHATQEANEEDTDEPQGSLAQARETDACDAIRERTRGYENDHIGDTGLRLPQDCELDAHQTSQLREDPMQRNDRALPPCPRGNSSLKASPRKQEGRVISPNRNDLSSLSSSKNAIISTTLRAVGEAPAAKAGTLSYTTTGLRSAAGAGVVAGLPGQPTNLVQDVLSVAASTNTKAAQNASICVRGVLNGVQVAEVPGGERDQQTISSNRNSRLNHIPDSSNRGNETDSAHLTSGMRERARWTAEYSSEIAHIRDAIKHSLLNEELAAKKQVRMHLECFLGWIGDIDFATISTDPYNTLDCDVLVLTGKEFHKLSSEGWKPDCCILVKGEDFHDKDVYTADLFLEMLRRKYPCSNNIRVQDIDSESGHPLFATVAQVRAWLDATPDDLTKLKPELATNLLDLERFGEAAMPAAFSLPRYQVINELSARTREPGKNSYQGQVNRPGKGNRKVKAADSVEASLARCKFFNIFGDTGSFSTPHVDLIPGTVVRCLAGVKAWAIPRRNLGNVRDVWRKAKTPRYWVPDGGGRIIIMEQGNVLIMPSGEIQLHAPFTIRRCWCEGYFYLDENTKDEIFASVAWIMANWGFASNEKPHQDYYALISEWYGAVK